jgi:WD40 repeat protein
VVQGKELYQLKPNLGTPMAAVGVTFMAFSPDGRWVLTTFSTGAGSYVCLWEAATGKLMHTLIHRKPNLAGTYSGGLNHAAFSPDYRWVVTACADRMVRVWDVATGRPVSLMQHQDYIIHVAFSPDSRRVVTIGDTTKAAQVWEAATGQPISPPLLHPDGILYASFSPDGRWVLTTSRHTARLWDLSPDSRPAADLIRRAQILRAGRIDQTGGYELLTIAEIRDAWQTLRTKYPQDFTVTPEQVRAWHRREAEACVREKNAAAAMFHYLQCNWDWLPNTWMFP